MGKTPGLALDRQERASTEEEDALKADVRLNLHYPFCSNLVLLEKYAYLCES